MTAIQPILLLLLVVGTIFYFRKLRSRLLDRCTVSLIVLVGGLLVASPGVAIKLAHWAGVGRGVDLVIYLALFGLGFSLLLVLSKIRDLEERLTDVARAGALASAKMPCGDGT